MTITPYDRAAMQDVVVRRMRRRHLRRVLEIEARAYPRPWSPALFVQELSLPDSRYYLVALAPSAGRFFSRIVVGYAGFLLQTGADEGLEAHVTTVAVDPEQHRRKIATHLLVGLMHGARQRDAGSVVLEVRAANRGAQRLYSSFGFTPVDVKARYYTETGEDAIIMRIDDLWADDISVRLERQQSRLSAPPGSSGAPDDPVPWVRGRVGLDGPRGH